MTDQSQVRDAVIGHSERGPAPTGRRWTVKLPEGRAAAVIQLINRRRAIRAGDVVWLRCGSGLSQCRDVWEETHAAGAHGRTQQDKRGRRTRYQRIADMVGGVSWPAS